ncbi:MAG: multidrug effflux MFS transporter [Alphaproteobacteria bacterium]
MTRPMPRPGSTALGALLTALVAFGAISTDLYLPSLPSIARDLETSVSRTQVTLSVFMFAFAFAQLVTGPMSDRFGRRRTLIGGLVLYILASIACIFVQSIEALIAARFVQALGACCGPVLSRAVVRDLYARADAARVLAYMGAAMGLIPAVAPVIGGQLEVWVGWRANFVFLTGFAAFVLAAVWGLLPETNKHRDPDALRPAHLFRNYAGFLADRTYLGLTGAVAFAFAGLFAFISGSSFVYIDLFGVRPDRFGFYFGACALGYAAGSLLSGRLVRRHAPERLLPVGGALCAAGGAVMAVLAVGGPALAGTEGALLLTLPMIVYMVGFGIVMPNGFAAVLGPYPRRAGGAAALVGFVQMAAAAAVGYAVGALHGASLAPMAVAVALCGTATLVASLLASRAPTAK